MNKNLLAGVKKTESHIFWSVKTGGGAPQLSLRYIIFGW